MCVTGSLSALPIQACAALDLLETDTRRTEPGLRPILTPRCGCCHCCSPSRLRATGHREALTTRLGLKSWPLLGKVLGANPAALSTSCCLITGIASPRQCLGGSKSPLGKGQWRREPGGLPLVPPPPESVLSYRFKSYHVKGKKAKPC